MRDDNAMTVFEPSMERNNRYRRRMLFGDFIFGFSFFSFVLHVFFSLFFHYPLSFLFLFHLFHLRISFCFRYCVMHRAGEGGGEALGVVGTELERGGDRDVS